VGTHGGYSNGESIDVRLSPRARKITSWGSEPTPEENNAFLARIRKRLRAIERADRVDWRAMFLKVDSSGDGSLSSQEFRKMVRGELLMGQNEFVEKELIMLFDHMDVNDDGFISGAEFTNFINEGREAGLDDSPRHVLRGKSAQREVTKNQRLQQLIRTEKLQPWQEKTDDEKHHLLSRVRKRLKAIQKNDGVNWLTMFSKSDVSGDSSLDMNEFRALMRRELLIGQREMSAHDCDIVFSHIDKDQTGNMEAEEFMAFVQQGGDDAGAADSGTERSPRQRRPLPWELAYGY